jgi:hypothetical protein
MGPDPHDYSGQPGDYQSPFGFGDYSKPGVVGSLSGEHFYVEPDYLFAPSDPQYQASGSGPSAPNTDQQSQP